MLKISLILLFILSSGTTIKAQEVYNYVLNNATHTVQSPTSGFTQTRIAQFKQTALTYLRKKATETMPEVTDQFLNTQAYYMSEFITLFFDEILKSKKQDCEKKKAKIMLFMDASKSNPLFDDTDTETTDSYILEGNQLTPFSLNTDWPRAYAAAKDNI